MTSPAAAPIPRRSARRGAAPRSLRWHLWRIVLAAVLPALVLGAALAWWMWQREQERVLQSLAETTRATAIAVERELQGSQRALQALAQSEHLTAGRLEEFYEQARRVLPSQPGWRTIILLSPDGQQLVNLRRPFGGELPNDGDRPHYQQVARTLQPVVSNVFEGRAAGNYVVDVVVPVLRDGALKYMLAAGYTAHEMDGLLQGATPADGVASILDSELTFVTRAREPQKFVGRKPMKPFHDAVRSAPSGGGRFPTFEGDEVFWAWAPLGAHGWSVAIAAPAGPVDASLLASLATISALSLLAGALGFAFAMHTARRIERPISELADAAGRVPDGAGLPEITTPVTELNRLSGALQSAAEKHRAANQADRRIAAILDNIADAFFTLDRDWRFITMNQAAAERIGADRIGTNVWQVFPDAVGNEAHTQLQRAMAERIAVEYEVFYAPWQRWFRDKAYPNDDGGLSVYSQDITEKKRAEQALRDSERRTAFDLAGMTRLQAVASLCARRDSDRMTCLDALLDAAIEMTAADKGNIQLLDARSRTLRIAAQRGFDVPFLDFFAEVAPGEAAVCGASLQSARRTVVADICESAIFAGQPAQAVLLEAGVRAVQSTPLIGSDGAVLGMLSTHFARPHEPDEAELRLIDLLARQAADWLQREQGEASLRDNLAELARFNRAMVGRELRMIELKDEVNALRARLGEPPAFPRRDAQALTDKGTIDV